jgi:hypothetical protein
MQAPSEVLGIPLFLLLVAGLAWACGKITGEKLTGGRATGKTGRGQRHQGGK